MAVARACKPAPRRIKAKTSSFLRSRPYRIVAINAHMPHRSHTSAEVPFDPTDVGRLPCADTQVLMPQRIKSFQMGRFWQSSTGTADRGTGASPRPGAARHEQCSRSVGAEEAHQPSQRPAEERRGHRRAAHRRGQGRTSSRPPRGAEQHAAESCGGRRPRGTSGTAAHTLDSPLRSRHSSTPRPPRRDDRAGVARAGAALSPRTVYR